MLIDIIKNVLKEATTDGRSGGSYVSPLQPGLRRFKKTQLGPFLKSVSHFDDADLNYDSLDGSLDVSKETAKKMEKRAKKISDFIMKNPNLIDQDDEGGLINRGQKISEWVEIKENTISEDLAVWFGTKKKPKGSKQPKGPWVNICRKKEGGGHPPCGRPDADPKGYPKCRAAGVASKMSDSQKRAACQQKRRAEKSNPKTGTGNSPTMTSYKPRKQNESMGTKIKITESQLKFIMGLLNEQEYQLLSNNKILYFVKDGDTYQVFKQGENRILSPTRMKLPKYSELAVTFDGEFFINNQAALDGNTIANSLMVPGDKGNMIVFTNSDGVPAMGELKVVGPTPLDTIKERKEKKLEEGMVYSVNDYIKIDRKFAKYLTVRNTKLAEKV